MSGFTGNEAHTQHTPDNCIYRGTKITRRMLVNILLTSGGFTTPTTKKRINQWADHYGYDLRVYQKNYDWYADAAGNTYKFHDDCCIVPAIKRSV